MLQALYNLSDDQAEYQLRDRLSFMRFLGLGVEDTVPDGCAASSPKSRPKSRCLLSQILCRQTNTGVLEDVRYVMLLLKRNRVID